MSSPTPLRIRDQQTVYPMPGPQDHNMPRPLSELLRNIVLPQCPPLYRPDAARTTVNPLRSKVQRRQDAATAGLQEPGRVKIFPRLGTVVYHPNLVDSLIFPAMDLLVNISLDVGNHEHILWLAKIHPTWTAMDLPTVLGSEKDTEKYVAAVMIHPIIRCLQAVDSGYSIQHSYYGQAFASGSGRGSDYPITDALIFSEDTVRATIEVKTHNALKAKKSNGTQPGTLEILMEVPCLAMKYHYPGAGETRPVSSQAKILLQVYSGITLQQSLGSDSCLRQVWEQMHDSGVDFAVLTSYEQIIFFYKRRGTDTMYMSRSCLRNDSPLLRLFAFLACATGLISRDKLSLFEPNTSWWSEDVLQNGGNFAGIHPR